MPGMEARYGSDGRAVFISDNTRRVTATRSLRGARQVTTFRPGGVRIVSVGLNHGFVERPLGNGFVVRTYITGARSSVAIYETRTWGQFVYQRYVPAVYYQPEFYQWAATPWESPISFSWGWAGQPWFVYYSSYFQPAPFYSSANVWLTDYVLGETLRSDYDIHMDTGSQGSLSWGRGSATNTQGNGINYDQGNGSTHTGSAMPDSTKTQIEKQVDVKLKKSMSGGSRRRTATFPMG